MPVQLPDILDVPWAALAGGGLRDRLEIESFRYYEIRRTNRKADYSTMHGGLPFCGERSPLDARPDRRSENAPKSCLKPTSPSPPVQLTIFLSSLSRLIIFCSRTKKEISLSVRFVRAVCLPIVMHVLAVCTA